MGLNTLFFKAEASSPGYVKTSLAAAMALKFCPGRFYRDAKSYCVNLLQTYPDGCKASCAYCGLSFTRKAEGPTEKTFIRVEWPTFPLNSVVQAIRREEHWLRRVCVSMITHRKTVEDHIEIIKFLKGNIKLPISSLATPTLMEKAEMEAIMESGADMMGIAVDCATKELFKKLRGGRGPHRWERYWRGVNEAVYIFGEGKVGVHLIVGLGETEEEMTKTIQRTRDLGARTHLFSFYPEPGSALENLPQPPMGQYRRVQLARYLIDNRLSCFEEMEFNEHGQIVDFGLPKVKLLKVIGNGEAFMTSGCPGRDGKLACNRPFANERPSQPLRNFPFPPSPRDIDEIKKQLRDYSPSISPSSSKS